MSNARTQPPILPPSPFSRGASVMSGVSETEERVARAIHPLAFHEDERIRHQYCSPLTVERVQASARDTARAAIAAMPQGEPVAWQWCMLLDENAQRWGNWIQVEAPLEHFKQHFKFELENKTARLRPVYTTPALPVSEPGVREALIKAKTCLLDGCLPWVRHNGPREGTTHGRIDETVAAIDAALTSPSNGEGWQPIETAPKDGTDVLVFCEAEQFVCFWNSENWQFASLSIGTDHHHVVCEPTHWRPLPLPPSPEAQP